MAHCNQYFCCLYRTVYNKKRKYLQKPLSLVNLIFFFLFLSFEMERKHSFFWEEWTGYIDLSFVFNHFCIFPTPNSIWSSRCVGVAPQAVVVCTSVGGSMVVGVERWGEVGKCGIRVGKGAGWGVPQGWGRRWRVWRWDMEPVGVSHAVSASLNSLFLRTSCACFS